MVLLDEKGKAFNSVEFANWIEQKQVQGISNLVFVVGGAFGFSDEEEFLVGLGRGDLQLSDVAEWVAYRILLRDYPATYTPVEIPIWPEAPL